MVHLEAMACGIPVITTENCGSIINNLEEGFIVPIRDPVALADKINEKPNTIAAIISRANRKLKKCMQDF